MENLEQKTTAELEAAFDLAWVKFNSKLSSSITDEMAKAIARMFHAAGAAFGLEQAKTAIRECVGIKLT